MQRRWATGWTPTVHHNITHSQGVLFGMHACFFLGPITALSQQGSSHYSMTGKVMCPNTWLLFTRQFCSTALAQSYSSITCQVVMNEWINCYSFLGGVIPKNWVSAKLKSYEQLKCLSRQHASWIWSVKRRVRAEIYEGPEVVPCSLRNWQNSPKQMSSVKATLFKWAPIKFPFQITDNIKPTYICSEHILCILKIDIL